MDAIAREWIRGKAANPSAMVSGKPMAIRLSCGAARLRIVRARLPIIKATTMGSASSSPEEKMTAPAFASFPQESAVKP
jgi:hypothetical protein